MADAEPPKPNAAEGTLLSHLFELRDRLVRALVGVALVSAPLLYYSNDVYLFVAAPLLTQLPTGSSMIATDITSPFVTPIKLALTVAFVLAAPWVLYQLWAFVAPGLYRRERKLVGPLIMSSTLLFYAGMAFAYYLVFPAAFRFFVLTAPPGVTVMTDIKQYLDFVLNMFIAFGAAFELPVVVVLLSYMGALDPKVLSQKRPYVFLGVAVVAALITPPDAFSMVALTLPMYGLFEVGLLVAHRLARSKADVEAAAREDTR